LNLTGFLFRNIINTLCTSEAKQKQNKMRLIVDSGSTKADWIAIDEEGKVCLQRKHWFKSKFLKTMKLLNV
jgi:activator of 2-hydroxyglutaryl-CoA dehydratase